MEHRETPLSGIAAQCPAGQWMTKTNMDLSELLAKHDQGDLLRGIAEAVLELIMETDVDGLIGAGRHERSGERPCVWLDATYFKVRQGGRIVPVAAIVTVAANTEGHREIISLGVGPSEAETFFTELLSSLRARPHIGETWHKVAKQLRPRRPKLADLMDATEHDVLVCMSFPRQHRTKLRSTNPIERLK